MVYMLMSENKTGILLNKGDGFMKKLTGSKAGIALGLAISMLTTMAVPAFAESNDLLANMAEKTETSNEGTQKYALGEVIVCLNGNYSAEDLNGVLNNSNARSAFNSGSVSEIRDLTKSQQMTKFRNTAENKESKKIYLLKLNSDSQNIYDVIEELEAHPEIDYASPNYLFEMDSPEANDIFYEDEEADAVLNMWGLEYVKGPQAWEYCSGSPDVAIGIVDSGVDFNHPDLAGNMWTNMGEWGENGELSDNGIDDDGNGYVDDVNGWNFYDDSNETSDIYGHGTHVAGTAAASGGNNMGVYGVAKDCKIAALKIASEPDSHGDSDYSFSAVIEALDYANAMNIPVTNNSYSQSNNYPPEHDEAFSEIFKAAINNYNGIFVASAGNDGEGYNANYPAGYDCNNIIAVSGSNRLGDPEYDMFNFDADTVDIAAPGINIWSCKNNTTEYVSQCGTSMAAPHVAGAVALLKSFKPDMTLAEIKDCILTTVTKTPGLAGIYFVGSEGVLNVEAAMIKAEEMYPSQTDPVENIRVWNFSDDKFAGIGNVNEARNIDGLSLYPDVELVDRAETLNGNNYTRYLDLKGKGSNEYREVVFPVNGNTRLTLSGRSVSEERTLQIVDSLGNVVGEMNVDATLKTEAFEYAGSPADLHIRSKKGGIRIYDIKAEQLG